MKKPSPSNIPQRLALEKLKVLDVCQQIFKLAEEVYQYLIDIHREEPEVARMWGLLAIDKCNHAETFKMAVRLKGEGIAEVNVTAGDAAQILERMKAVPTWNSANPTPSAVEALRFALRMEERLNHVHFRHVFTYHNEPDLHLMISTLRSGSTIIHMLTEEYVNLALAGSSPHAQPPGLLQVPRCLRCHPPAFVGNTPVEIRLA
jgi:hypothetical protein